MTYEHAAIPDGDIPASAAPNFAHIVETYASETNKVVSVWRCFEGADLEWRPHPKSSSVRQIFEHQLLSERRFFAEFLGSPEPVPAAILPAERTLAGYVVRFAELARPRLGFLASHDAAWWRERTRFFDVDRERIWIFWRRVLHTAHHRTQLTVYLRLLERPTPSTYGPTADVTWSGADPTVTVEAAGRAAESL